MTEPDHLKSAAEYLLQVARSSEGRRYRKQPKIHALRQYKEEILEAHRSGLSVHRIAQIFRERGVDISVPHLERTVRRFVDEEERAGKGSPAPHRPASEPSVTNERRQESAAAEGTKPKAPVTYQVSETTQHQSPRGGICEAIAACALPGSVESAAGATAGAGSPAKNA